MQENGILSDTVRRTVSSLLTTVGREIVMPRYRALHSSEIMEKSPGETVTIVDHEVEAALQDGLASLIGGARIVGEEAASADSALMDGLSEGLLWLIDPVDGTSNFAAGKPPFGIMVALVSNGEVIGAWILDPMNQRLCYAERDRGAFVDNVAIHVGKGSGTRPIAALATQFMMAEQKMGVERGFAESFDLVPIPRCAAEHYPRLVFGSNQVALFQRTLPWDHAAGALFLTEAGGHVARWDGSPYRIGDGKLGILAAGDRDSWQMAFDVMQRLDLPDTAVGVADCVS